MKWITEYFIKNVLKKSPEDQAAKKSPLKGGIKNISIIAPSLVELHETEDILKIELNKHIEFNGLFYGEGTEAKEAFSYKDFSLLGNPKEKVAKFLAIKPDIIIASSEMLNSFSLYLLYLNPQAYSIGFYQESHKPYLDLMLAKEDKDPKENMEHLIKYLKQVILK
ncbi:MAG: hypothetical protein WD426_10435 [Anditalea sp.]